LLSDDKDTGWIADRLHQLFGVTEVTAGADELAWAARRFFELLASSAPLIVIFDDIHWAEPTFLDLIEHVADWSRDAPIMLLAIARPELHGARPSWAGGKLNATSIMLEPLGAEDSQRLIANLLGQDEAEPQLAARIIEAAEGNPFFVEEMVSMLIDRGVLQSSEGGWQVPADLSTVSTPPTVQALLAARLDQLTPAKRETAQRAAVIGRVFWRDAVLEMTPVDERPGVGSALMALIRKEVVRPDRSSFQGQDAFRFRHALIRDAAYQALPKESRGDLHERFAHWLEQAAGQRKAEFDEILGYHYEQAYRYRTELGRADVDAVQSARRAAELLEAAGTRAKERADYPAAAKLLNRTVALLPAGSPQRIELLAELAGILYETGDFSEASNVLQQAQEELEEAPDARAEDLVEVQRWTLQLSVEPGAEAEAELAARNAIATFESTGDLGGLAYAYRLLQWILLTNENYTQLAETAQKAIHCSRSAGQHQQADESLDFLLGAVMHGPMKVDDAVRLCATLFDENKHRRVAVPHIQRAQAHLSAMQLEFDKARELLAQSNESLVEQGRVVSSAAGQGVVGTQIEAMAENWAAAEAISRSAWETLVGLGEKGFASTIAAQLAVVLARQGKADAAIEFADAGAELGSPSDIATQATARQGKAEALAIRGDLEIAESLAREAVNLQSATDAIGESGEAYISLAVVLERAGKADKAANAIRQAIELFERKGNLASLANARARLQRLALPA
jgi:tetratricopeptide (TPR) repeat protein